MSTETMVAVRPQKAVRYRRKKRQRLNVRLSTVVCLLIPLALVVFVFALVSSALSQSVAAPAGMKVEASAAAGETQLSGVVTELSVETNEIVPLYTDYDVSLIAKTVYGEALVTGSDTQMSAVAWCILNRVDSTGYGCGKSIEYVVTFPNQFVGYRASNPVTEHIEWLVRDVLDRWSAEHAGQTDVGRTLPKDYLWFSGNGRTNTFRNDYKRSNAKIWDWSAESPYSN